MSDEAPPTKCPEGSPPWVMTFADLMSLLMCFFVLLLSFSEMDVLKFKQIAGSMSHAFGVQREIKAKEIPKGTSVVMKEFSPAKPEPTALNEVRQHSTDELRRMLDTEEQNDAGKQGEDEDTGQKSREELLRELALQALEDAEQLRESFASQLEQGLIDIETDQERIIIRIRENGSFPSGSAALEPLFEPVIRQIGEVLARTEGAVVVAGHTDNIPISTQRFRSNWELSAARAVTVVHNLKRVAGLAEDRILIEGHADSRPLVPNDTVENRARNRRVEIVIVKGSGTAGEISIESPSVETQAAG